MIFKTTIDELGNTKLSVNNGLKGLSSGVFKKQSILSDGDIAALQAYNAELNKVIGYEVKNGQVLEVTTDAQTAYNRTMLDASETAQNMAASADGLAVNLEQIPKVSKAGQAALKGLAIAGNMALMWLASQGIELIVDFATASDRLRESAKELGSAFSSTKSEINDYKTKIEDLYGVINDNSSSYEDTSSARQELLKIQDEMIEKFGKEADAIGLVTSAINGQTEALDILTKEQWKDTKLNFNNPDQSLKKDFTDAWLNIFSGVTNNYDRMIKEVENSEITFSFSPQFDNDSHKEFLRRLKDEYNATVINNGQHITLSGELNDVYSQLQNIYTLANSLGIEDSYLSSLFKQTKEAKNALEEYSEIYNQYILYDKVFQETDDLNDVGDTYEEVFNQIRKAYQSYQDAFESGDQDAIEAAKQTYAEIVQEATNGIDDDTVVEFFKAMYPELQEIVSGWSFEVKFKAALEDDGDKFEEDVKKYAGEFNSVEDIKGYSPKIATKEQKDAYVALEAIAQKYGLSIDQLADKMYQMNIIQNQVKQDLIDKFDSKAAANWITELSDEEAKLAHSKEFEQFLDAQRDKLGKAELSARDYEIALQKVKDVQNKLAEKTSFSFDQKTFNDTIKSFEDGYSKLISVQEEWNETGSISASSFAELQESGLLEYIEFTSDGLIINTDKLLENAQASKDKAVADLHAAMMSDMLKIAIGDVDNVSQQAQSVIAQLGNNAETAGLQALSSVSNWATLGETISQVMAEAGVTGINTVQRTQMNSVYNYYKSLAKNISSIDITTPSRSKKSGSSSKKTQSDIQKEWKEYLDKYLAMYKAELDAGLIDFNTFLNKSRALLDEYYRDGEIAAKDYWDGIKSLYEQQLVIYDRVLSAVSNRYDKEIEKINDVIDSLDEQNDALEKQLDEYDKILSVVDKVYDNQIKALENEKNLLQDKINAINDANDALDLQLRKEQALYALKHAQEQRTKKIYNGTEFIYDTDKEAIRDAQQTFQEIETEELIKNIEKEQEAIDGLIEELEKYRDLWQEITDTYDDEINEQLAIALWGKNYEKVILSNRISDINNFKNKYVSIQRQINDNKSLIDSYNEKVKYYQSLKDAWSSIADEYKKSVDEQLAAQVLGANWESDILNGRIDVMNNFRNQYNAIQQAIKNAAWESANAQIAAINAVKSAEASKGSVSSSNDSKPSAPVQSKPGAMGGGGAGRKEQLFYRYGTGTKDAEQGYQMVGDGGDEIIRDNYGNAFLAKGEQLHYFEGGETVFNPSETSKLLSNSGNIEPIDTNKTPTTNWEKFTVSQHEFATKWNKFLENYSNMTPEAVRLPKLNVEPARNNSVPIVQHISLTLPNVTNESGYERIQKELRQAQLDAIQYAHRR